MKNAFPRAGIPSAATALLPAAFAFALALAPGAAALTDAMAVSAAAETAELDRMLALLEEDGAGAVDELALRSTGSWSVLARSDGLEEGEEGDAWEFEAADSSANYPVGTDWNGANGGSGFKAWESTGDEPAARTVAADGGFYLQAADSGQSAIVMRRELDTAAGLQEGSLSVTSWGYADEPGDFVGFAIYGSDVEIFRWGLGLDGEGVSVFKYSTDGGNSYTVVAEGYPAAGADFSLTWSSLGGTMSLVWSEASYFPDGVAVTLAVDLPVTAVAAVLEEGGVHSAGGNGTEMTVDNQSVKGTPVPSVPEPGTLGLLLSGLAALALRRRA